MGAIGSDSESSSNILKWQKKNVNRAGSGGIISCFLFLFFMLLWVFFLIWGIFYVKYCEFQLVYTVFKYSIQEYQTQGQMSAFHISRSQCELTQNWLGSLVIKTSLIFKAKHSDDFSWWALLMNASETKIMTPTYWRVNTSSSSHVCLKHHKYLRAWLSYICVFYVMVLEVRVLTSVSTSISCVKLRETVHFDKCLVFPVGFKTLLCQLLEVKLFFTVTQWTWRVQLINQPAEVGNAKQKALLDTREIWSTSQILAFYKQYNTCGWLTEVVKHLKSHLFYQISNEWLTTSVMCC